MTEDSPGGPLDVATLEVLGRRANDHPLVSDWSFRPDAVSPRRLELRLDAGQYPEPVDAVRLDVRWYEGGDYTLHYVESRAENRWQCRWDRHPKPDGPRAHFHPPPTAAGIEEREIEEDHHLGVCFGVLDWIEGRVERLHDER